MNKVVVAVGVLAVLLVGCGKLKTESVRRVIIKDIPLEEQNMLLDKYVGRSAWTRTRIEDLTERQVQGEPKKKVIPIDTRVEIVDLNFVYSGSVTMEDSKRRFIVAGLDCEKPLSVDKIEARLADMMWFQSPLLRQVDYIRKWGTKTARAVVNHEVFIGMQSEAALESWGIPSTVRTSPIGDTIEEQWVYKQPLKSKYIYIKEGKVTKWED
jgi:hypothetical protein